MTREPRRVALEGDTDLRRVVEEVCADKTPRLIERDGKPLAVVIPAEEYADIMTMHPSVRSPRDFYEEATRSEDIRRILRRLASE